MLLWGKEFLDPPLNYLLEEYIRRTPEIKNSDVVPIKPRSQKGVIININIARICTSLHQLIGVSSQAYLHLIIRTGHAPDPSLNPCFSRDDPSLPRYCTGGGLAGRSERCSGLAAAKGHSEDCSRGGRGPEAAAGLGSGALGSRRGS